MDKYEAVGVLRTLIDFEDSPHIREALELSIKALQSTESTPAQQSMPIPTQEEMWNYLKALPYMKHHLGR